MSAHIITVWRLLVNPVVLHDFERSLTMGKIAECGFRTCLSVVLSLMLMSAQHACATPILNNDSLGAPRNDFDGMVGYDVQVGGANQAVSALGLWDQNQNGLASAHLVGLWNSVGTLLGSATVPAGTGGTLVGEFRYVNLGSPVLLTAGQIYTLGVEIFTGGDTFRDIDGTATYAPEFIPKRGRYNVGGGFAQPVSDAGFDAPYAGPNAIFGPPVEVPEPSTVALSGIGAILIGMYHRTRRSS
jgi:hypothetical protein